MMLNRKIVQALVFGFVLAITGCGDDAPANGGNGGTGGDGAGGTGGDGAGGTGGGTGGNVMAGLYAGIDGNPDFDGDGDGWAVCLWVDNNMIQLVDDNRCNLRNLFNNENSALENAFAIEVDNRGTPNNCDFDIDYESEVYGAVPVNQDGTFSKTQDVIIGTWSFSGTISGNNANGTASQTVGGETCSIDWTATFRNP